MTPLDLSVIYIDDSNPTIVYQGSWETELNGNAFNGSWHVANAAGYSVRYVFNGSSIQASGYFQGIRDVPTYSLDGETPRPLASIPSNISPSEPYSLLDLKGLNEDQHTLIITTVSNSTFTLDSLAIPTPYDAILSTRLASGGSPLNRRDHHHHTSDSTVVILVALACVILVLALVTAAVIYRYRRRRPVEQPESLNNAGPFDVLPDIPHAQSSRTRELFRFKKPSRARNAPRTSSTLFTSVIFAPPSSHSSRR